MAAINRKYTKEELKLVENVICDLSDLYYDPNATYNDTASAINDILVYLKTKKRNLLKGANNDNSK